MLDRYEIHNLSVAPDHNGLVAATFRAEWIVHDNPSVNGSARERLTFRRENGTWKIIGEEQLQATSVGAMSARGTGP